MFAAAGCGLHAGKQNPLSCRSATPFHPPVLITFNAPSYRSPLPLGARSAVPRHITLEHYVIPTTCCILHTIIALGSDRFRSSAEFSGNAIGRFSPAPNVPCGTRQQPLCFMLRRRRIYGNG